MGPWVRIPFWNGTADAAASTAMDPPFFRARVILFFPGLYAEFQEKWWISMFFLQKCVIFQFYCTRATIPLSRTYTAKKMDF